MSIFTNFVCKKINEKSSLDSTQKKVLTTAYRKGDISLGDLRRALKSKEGKESLKERCEDAVLNTYLNNNSNSTRSVINRKNNPHYGYKPIDAEIFWTTVATKQGYKMQEHFSGRRRILTNDGYWVASESKYEIERKFALLR